MDMHIPQARDQKLARCVDDAGAGRRRDILRDAGNAAVSDGHRHIRARGGASRVYDGGVLENDALGE